MLRITCIQFISNQFWNFYLKVGMPLPSELYMGHINAINYQSLTTGSLNDVYDCNANNVCSSVLDNYFFYQLLKFAIDL